MEITIPTDWGKVADSVTENEPRFAMDSKIYAQFYIRPTLFRGASEAAGRPIYHDIEHIRILIPGDKLSQVDRMASEEDKQRFSAQYAKFKAGKGEEIVGTRLEAVPWMTRSKVEEYKYFGIHSVEQLAEANDEVGQKFPGFNADRDKAKKFINATTGTDARVAALEAQIAQMTAQLSAQKNANVASVEVAAKK